MIYKNRLPRLFRKLLDNLIYTRKMKHKDFIRKIRRYSNKAYMKNKSNLKIRVLRKVVPRREVHRKEEYHKEENRKNEYHKEEPRNTFDERSSFYKRNSYKRNSSYKRSSSKERNSHFLTDIFIRDDLAFYPMFLLLFIIALFITGYTQKYISLNMLVNQMVSKEIDYDAFREMNLNEDTISNIMKQIETEKNKNQSNQDKESSTSSEKKDTSDVSNSRIDSDIVLNIEKEDSNNKKGQVIEYANNQIVTGENNSDLKKDNNTSDKSVVTTNEPTYVNESTDFKEQIESNKQIDDNKQTDTNNQTKSQEADTNKSGLYHNQYQKFSENIKERNGIADLTLMMLLQNYNAVDKKRISNSDLNYLFQILKNNDRFKELYTYYTVMLTDLELFPIGDSVDGGNIYTFSDTWNAPRTYGGERKHEGADIFPEENKAGYYPIVSVSNGVVEKMGWLNQGGYRIGVRSSSGAYFYYAHLDSYAPDLEIGDEITTGQFLGYMGNSGYGKEGTKGMFEVHLHFGIYLETKNGELSVNPYRVLRYLQNKRD